MNYYEVMFEDGFAIAIKGKREPTIEEAQKFCHYEYANVIEFLSLEEEEMREYFDCSNIDNWPIFGEEEN